MIVPALKHGEYSVRTQVVVGRRIGGRRHKVVTPERFIALANQGKL